MQLRQVISPRHPSSRAGHLKAKGAALDTLPPLLLLVAALAALTLPYAPPPGEAPPGRPAPASPAGLAAAPSFDDFAYPRGENVAYGWMACGYSFPNDFSDPSRCVEDGYTLINDMYGNMSADNFGRQAQRLAAQSRLRQFMPYLGAGPYRTQGGFRDVEPFPIDDAERAQEWWDGRLAAIRRQVARSANPDHIFGFYTTDEPIVVEELKYQYNAVKRHFPQAIVFAYGTTYDGPWSALKDRVRYDDERKLTTSFGVNGEEAMPYADVAGVAHYYTYSKLRYPERISHGIVYYRIQALVDGICTQYDHCRGRQADRWSWKRQGKPLYFVPEAYKDACVVSSADPDRSSPQRVYAKITNEIAQSVAAGAQGVLAYEYDRFRQGLQPPECYNGVRDFYAIYRELWPWIRAGNLERKRVTITSGMARWQSPPTWRFEPDHPTLVATQLDLAGRRALVVVNLMSPSDFDGAIAGTVSGLDNNTYEQLSLNQAAGRVERREVVVGDGRISVTLPPYGYAIFVEKSAGGASPTAQPRPSPPPAQSVRGVIYERWEGLAAEVNADLAALKGDGRYPGEPTERQVLTDLTGLELPFHAASDGGAEFFGSRLRALLVPPASGVYEFYLSGDDSAELLLSTDERAANARQLAVVRRWVHHRDYFCTRSAECGLSTLRSGPVELEAGRRYYLELNHVESVGEDHATVAWRAPGSSTVEIVPAAYLRLPPDATAGAAAPEVTATPRAGGP